jgi:hypothetical protein
MTYIPRLNVELTEDLVNGLNRTIPWGIRKYLYQLLTEALIEAVETAGNDILAAILRRQAKIKIIPLEPLK